MKNLKIIPHPDFIELNSREHVIWWDGNGRHCSEKNCEVNNPVPRAKGGVG